MWVCFILRLTSCSNILLMFYVNLHFECNTDMWKTAAFYWTDFITAEKNSWNHWSHKDMLQEVKFQYTNKDTMRSYLIPRDMGCRMTSLTTTFRVVYSKSHPESLQAWWHIEFSVKHSPNQEHRWWFKETIHLPSECW